MNKHKNMIKSWARLSVHPSTHETYYPSKRSLLSKLSKRAVVITSSSNNIVCECVVLLLTWSFPLTVGPRHRYLKSRSSVVSKKRAWNLSRLTQQWRRTRETFEVEYLVSLKWGVGTELLIIVKARAILFWISSRIYFLILFVAHFH